MVGRSIVESSGYVLGIHDSMITVTVTGPSSLPRSSSSPGFLNFEISLLVKPGLRIGKNDRD